MRYKIRFRPEVVDDLAEASSWYNSQSADLGADFLEEFQNTKNCILKNPELFAAEFRRVRSMRLQRFPYVVHYRIEADRIVLIAVLYGGRDPSAWQDRA